MSKPKFEVKKPYKFTDTQNAFLRVAMDESTKLIFIDGPAGAAKTFLAVYVALKYLSEKRYDHLLYIRSIVESAHKQFGILPGAETDKFKPWTIPLLDKMDELVNKEIAAKLFIDEKVKCMPVNYLRGSTFTNNVVIVDEAQNNYFDELQTVLTRIGENSKVFVIGDTMQADIGSHSGFKKVLDAFDTPENVEKGIHVFRFTEEDIKRSEILKHIITILKTIKK